MPVYVGLFNFTESGLRAVREAPARTREVVLWLEDQGFEVKSAYFTMGQYDLICVIESPDEHAQIRAVLALNQQGLFRTTTLRAYSVDEFANIIEEYPQ